MTDGDARSFFTRGSAPITAPVLALLFLLFATAPTAAQQTGAVSGTVRASSTGTPLNGAQVVVEGTGIGSLTGDDGSFTLRQVPSGEQSIAVRMVGYGNQSRTVNVSAGQTATVDFRLSVSAVSMEEIVVTGQAGEVERRELGVDVASLDASEVAENTNPQNIGELIGSNLPGVRSASSVGGVGTAQTLRVRGTTSFRLGQRPVVYIDGVRVDTNADTWGWMSGVTCCFFAGGAAPDRLNDLDPSNIERIEILKGASAATLYGSEASNGVIQIFTKSGRTSQPPSFNLQVTTGLNRLRPNLRTRLYPQFEGPDGFQAWDANEKLIETGRIYGFDLSARGGAQDVTYYFAGGYSYEQGSLQPNDQKKANLRVNLSWIPSELWRFEVRSAYNRNDIHELQSGNNWMSMMQATVGNPRQATQECPYGEPWVCTTDIRETETGSNASRWTGGFTGMWRPLDDMSHRLALGLDYGTEQKQRILPYGNFYVYLGEVGEKNIGYREFQTYTADYLGQYSLDVSDDFQSEVSWGVQGFWEMSRNSMATGKEFAGPGVTTVSGGSRTIADEAFRETINVGLFGQNRFSFWDKLFLTVGFRVDGNSAFGEDFGLEEYPKADMAYHISREGFIPGWISNLKLRGAIGQSGKFPGPFTRFRTFTPLTVQTDQPGVVPLNPGNRDLQPERTTEYELGFDAGLFDDRLGINVTAHRARTTDALLEVPLPPSRGFPQPQIQNAGEVVNRGLEVGVEGTAISTEDLTWSSQLNLNWSDNEIGDLGAAATDGRLGSFRQGFPVNSVWAYAIQDYDPDTQQFTRTDTAIYHGPQLPTFEASLSQTLRLGSFRLYGQIAAESGAVFGNGGRAYAIRFRTGDEYLQTLDGLGTDDPTATTTTDSLYNRMTLVTPVDSRDNIRLRNVSIAYQIPDQISRKVGMEGTSLTLSGSNLHWWDDCHCRHPNMQYQGGDTQSFSGFLAAPPARRVTLELQTSF